MLTKLPEPQPGMLHQLQSSTNQSQGATELLVSSDPALFFSACEKGDQLLPHATPTKSAEHSEMLTKQPEPQPGMPHQLQSGTSQSEGATELLVSSDTALFFSACEKGNQLPCATPAKSAEPSELLTKQPETLGLPHQLQSSTSQSKGEKGHLHTSMLLQGAVLIDTFLGKLQA